MNFRDQGGRLVVCAASLAFLCGIVERIPSIPAASAEVRAPETGYGTITGQFVLEGDIPAKRVLVAAGAVNVNNANICAAANLFSDELLVDPETKGIANVCIYLAKATVVHPKLKGSAMKELVFDQKGCRFDPHVLFVRTDQTVLVKSADNCNHNTHTYPARGQGVNLLVKPNERTGEAMKMKVPENLPIPVKCDLHPWMIAHWLVLDHPYGAVTDEAGKFTIADLPAGEYEFRVWHELPGYLERKWAVKVESGKVTDLGVTKVSTEKLTGKK